MTKTTRISINSTNCNNSAIGNLPLLPILRTKSQLNKIIVNKDGTPDYLAINIYWDTMRSWHVAQKIYSEDGQVLTTKKLKTKEIYTNYKKLSELHGVSTETIRQKIVKLEKLGLINRSFKHKETVTTKSFNQLIIYVWQDTPHFFNPCGIVKDDAVNLNPYTSHMHIAEKHNIVFDSKLLHHNHQNTNYPNTPILAHLDRGVQAHLDTKELNKEKKLNKNRSMRSNFFEISLKEVSNENEAYDHKRKNSDYNHNNDNLINELQDYNTKTELKHPDFSTENLCTKTKTDISLKDEISVTSSLVTSDNTTINSENDNSATCSKKQSLPKKIISFFKKPKQLKDFHPLSLEDCRILQSSSGREFTQVAMNEILLDMSRRLSEPHFYSKKGFMAYMTKAFIYEKRDAVKVSSENFKIRNNESPDAITEREQEAYLTEIEYSLEVSPEWHLKKKLASVLERSKAYSFLTAFRSIIQSGTCIEIILTKPVHLSKLERQIVENQVRATHDKLGKDGSFELITEITITMPESATKKRGNITSAVNNVTARVGVWGQIRTAFAKAFGANGDAIDMNWMTKLEASVDEASKTINLKAPSDFIKNFVESRYLSTIEQIVKQIGFQLQPIECQKRGQ